MGKAVFALNVAIFSLLLRLGYCQYRETNNKCDSVLKKNSCTYEVTCFGGIFIEERRDLYSNRGRCSQTVQYNGENFVPIRLVYKFNNPLDDVVLLTDNSEFIKSVVTALDFSDNKLYGQPTLEMEIDELHEIDFSHNNIIYARFFDLYHERPNLAEIDFSYNDITTVEVDDQAYVFKELNKINLSHNNIIEIPLQFFNNFHELLHLDLSNNKISNITSETFEGISKLNYLDISFNNIIDINTSLFRFTKVKELNFSNNQISHIITKNFDNLNELNVLDLSNNIISTLDDNVFINKFLLTTIDIKYNRLQTLGRNLFIATNDIKNIDLSYNNITFLSKNMFVRKHILMFSIKGNNLTGPLERGLFDGLDSIPELDISHQSVTSVGNHSFFGLTKLTQLLLNNNFIKFLSINSFLTLKSLQRLDLSHNQIVKIDFVKSDLLNLKYFAFKNNFVEQIQVEDFFYLHKLQYIDLSHNNISRVQSKSFQTLSSLDNFFLYKNPLRGSLEEGTFDGLFGVPLLDLSGTSLSLIKNNSFDGMVHLYDLNISHSKISELQYNAFINTDNIETIDLSYNELKYFSVNSSNLKSLKDLRLNSNIIKALPQDFVKGIFYLNKLILSHNDLSMLHNNTFQDQNNLRYLDVSYNLFSHVDLSLIKYAYKLDTLILSGSPSNITFAEIGEVSLTKLEMSNCNLHDISFLNLQKVKNIQILLLSENNVTQIDNEAFSHLDCIKEMDISYNSIKFIGPGAFNDCHQLNVLNISHNFLSVLKYGIFRGLAHLNVLDISYNYLNSLETSRFNELPNLSELVVDHNRITDISVEDMGDNELQKISIGDNPLPCDTLIKLVKYSRPGLVVTAIRKVEKIDESFHGIGCNYYKHMPYQKLDKQVSRHTKYNESISENILIDIRDILLNISSDSVQNNDKTIINNKIDYEKSTKSLEEGLLRLNNITSLVEKESRNTNQYFERLLKLLAAMNSLTTKSETRSNLKTGSNQDIDKLKVQIENDIVIEKEKILGELSDKLLAINRRIDSLFVSTTSAPLKEHLSSSEESKSSVFIETCVVLILFILVTFVLYKVYKSRCYIINRWSASTRRISEMENSNL